VQRTAIVLVLFVALVLDAPSFAAARTSALRPAWTKNCSALNGKYRHGVGKLHAHDKTTGVPVTTFRRSTRLYNVAMRWNKGLDRDHDAIACERR
jgi:hypothetical protein